MAKFLSLLCLFCLFCLPAFSQSDLAEEGANILAAAGCINCHDLGGGNPNSKMLPIASTYVTEEVFEQIVRAGRYPGGGQMTGIMPFKHFALMTDEDVHKLYAYYVSYLRPDIVIKPAKLPSGERFAPEQDKSSQYNRGSYLVNAISYCGACHAPDGGFKLSGGTMAAGWNLRDNQGNVMFGKNWEAYNISSDKAAGIGSWNVDDLTTFLIKGSVAGKGTAGGLMGSKIVQNMTSFMDEADVRAIAAYLLEAPAYAGNEKKPRYAYGELLTYDDLDTVRVPLTRIDEKKELSGFVLFNSLCATCHGWSGEGGNYAPALVNNSTVGSASSSNLILTILQGVTRRSGGEMIFMPAFAQKLTNKEAAELVNFIEKQFGNHEVTVSENNIVVKRR